MVETNLRTHALQSDATESRKRQKLYLSSEASAQNYRCEPCSRPFTTRRAYLRHLRENKKHRGNGVSVPDPISCSVCGKAFARAHDRDRHCKEQHFDGKVACTECGKLVRPNTPHKNPEGTECGRSRGSHSPGSTSSSKSDRVDLSQCEGLPDSVCNSALDSLSEQLSRTKIGHTPPCPKAYKGQVRAAKPNRPLPCGICRTTFEIYDTAALFEHLKFHFDGLNSKHRCYVCEIDFVHAADLERHQASAMKGDCGFNFLHKTSCSGHHPPADVSPDDLVLARDNDRFSFCYRIRSWERSQLQAYVRSVKSLIDSEALVSVHCRNDSHQSGERQGCHDPRCKRCRVLIFYRHELGPVNPSKAEMMIGKDCHDKPLVREVVTELVRYYDQIQNCPSSRRRSASFSEGCPSYAATERTAEAISGTDKMKAIDANLSNEEIPQDSTSPTNHWQRILHLAAASGEVELVRLALNNGADINRPDLDGRTALHLAAFCGSEDVVEALLQAKPWVDPYDRFGSTALSIAMQQKNFGVKKLLSDYRALSMSHQEADEVGYRFLKSRKKHANFSMNIDDSEAIKLLLKRR